LLVFAFVSHNIHQALLHFEFFKQESKWLLNTLLGRMAEYTGRERVEQGQVRRQEFTVL